MEVAFGWLILAMVEAARGLPADGGEIEGLGRWRWSGGVRVVVKEQTEGFVV